MANNPEYQRDPNYRKSGSSAGWWIAGVIALVIIVAALYQNHVRNADNLSNIEPAAGSSTMTNTTNSYDMQNSNTVTNTMSEPNTNTTNP